VSFELCCALGQVWNNQATMCGASIVELLKTKANLLTYMLFNSVVGRRGVN